MGGLLAAALYRGGARVSLLARGASLEALRARGLRMTNSAHANLGEIPALRITASDDPAELGPQDAVLLCLKAQQVKPALPAIEALLGPESVVIAAQNGIPWWYFHGPPEAPGLPKKLAGRCLDSVDPGGEIAKRLPAERVAGCILYLAAELAAPGLVNRGPGGRILLGPAANGPASSHVAKAIRDVAQLLNAGGETAELREHIRIAVWEKLWGNVAMNPLSALTGATLGEIAQDPALRKLCRDVMLETEAVAAALGINFDLDAETRIDRAGRIGAHRSSMLQDLAAGRAPETGALMMAVSEIGGLLGLRTPFLDAITTLVEARVRHAR
jgi:2-dehydropantoate 2-reductase